MSEILGHDCDGRELRAGDRVEVVVANNHPELLGVNTNIVGTNPLAEKMVFLSVPPKPPYLAVHAECRQLRLINSGRELFDQCAQRHFDKLKEVRADILARRTVRKPAEASILRSMPWTGADEQ